MTLLPSRFSPFFILVKINQGNTKEDCRSENSVCVHTRVSQIVRQKYFVGLTTDQVDSTGSGVSNTLFVTVMKDKDLKFEEIESCHTHFQSQF